MLIRRRKICLAIALCVSILSVNAQNRQRVFELSGPVYDYLRLLAREAGKELSTNAFPLSEAEVRRMIGELKPAVNSVPGKKALASLEEILDGKPLYDDGTFAADADAELNTEFYFHTARENTIWAYSDEKRAPFFSFPLQAWAGDNFYIDLDLDLRKEPLQAVNPDTWNNIITGMDSLDITMPYRGFLAAGGDNWNLQFGRDDVSWGPGRSGTLFVSNYADYFEFLKLAFWGRDIKFTSLIVSLEPWLYQWEEAAMRAAGFNFEPSKTFIAHRLEFRLFDLATVSVSEGLMLGGKYPELRYLNPLMVYHNFYLEKMVYNLDNWGNSIFSADISCTPFPGVTLYGEYVLDQLQTAYENEKWGTPIPDATGALLGTEISYPLGPGYIGGFAEWVYTSPFLYVRENPLVTFSTRRIFISNSGVGARPLSEKPIGYESGPDSITMNAAVRYQVPFAYTVGAEYAFRVQGANNLHSPYVWSVENAAKKTPSGIPEERHIIGFSGSMHPFPFFSFGARLALVLISNTGHVTGFSTQDTQLTFCATFSTGF